VDVEINQGTSGIGPNLQYPTAYWRRGIEPAFVAAAPTIGEFKTPAATICTQLCGANAKFSVRNQNPKNRKGVWQQIVQQSDLFMANLDRALSFLVRDMSHRGETAPPAAGADGAWLAIAPCMWHRPC
jgi:hypothetical protein